MSRGEGQRWKEAQAEVLKGKAPDASLRIDVWTFDEDDHRGVETAARALCPELDELGSPIG